jgi:hypothetical protein
MAGISKTAGAVLALALVAPGAAATAATRAKIDYHDTFGTRAPATSSAFVRQLRIANVAGGQAKPPAIQHVHSVFPKGARIDTAAVRRCEASDAEIMLEGPSACPARSRVGKDSMVIDQGTPTSDRYVHEDIKLFNADHQLLIVVHDPSGAWLVVRGQLGRRTLDIEVPPLPGTPPDGGAIKTETAVIYAAGRPHHGYITTPGACPRSRRWTFRTDYTYRDGSKQTVRSHSPCLPRHHRGRGAPR